MTSQVTRETIDLNSLLARAKNSAAGAVLLFSGMSETTVKAEP